MKIPFIVATTSTTTKHKVTRNVLDLSEKNYKSP